MYRKSTSIRHFEQCRDDDFPRSRKTDGKRGINHWKRKTYFQTEKHGNVLLTTCCTEICNKSDQIQRKKKNVAFIHALKSIGEWYRPSHASCHIHVMLPWPGHGSLSSLHVHGISFQQCNGDRLHQACGAQRICVQKYFCCKRTLAWRTLTTSQFSHRSAQSRLVIPCTVYMRYEASLLCNAHESFNLAAQAMSQWLTDHVTLWKYPDS